MPNCSSLGADAFVWLIDQTAAGDFTGSSEFAPFRRACIARVQTSGVAGERSAAEQCRHR